MPLGKPLESVPIDRSGARPRVRVPGAAVYTECPLSRSPHRITRSLKRCRPPA
jgi:hypothetical protein